MYDILHQLEWGKVIVDSFKTNYGNCHENCFFFNEIEKSGNFLRAVAKLSLQLIVIP